MYKYLLFLAAVFFGSKDVLAENGTFWHVTDIHVDQNYSRNGDTKHFCHETEQQSAADLGLYGNFLCDSPQILVNLTVASMRKLEPKADFIIWTGDNLPHVWDPDPEWSEIYEVLSYLTDLLRSNFPEVPIYPSIGNHDSFPQGIIVPQERSNESMYADYLYKGGWEKIIPKPSWDTFLIGGYYSTPVPNVQGLHVVSLNTILWYEPNEKVKDLEDPADQFQWLESVLKNASATKEKVYIIGHVPPGFYNKATLSIKVHKPYTYHPQFLKKYLDITGKYYDAIAGQFFGHLHLNTFQLFQFNSGVTRSSSLLASSVTPWHTPALEGLSLPVNPSIRLMHYERTNGSLMNYNQFFLNLTATNMLSPEEEPKYELLYTFTEAYGVPDVSTESLYKVYEKLKSDNETFNLFNYHMTAGEDSTPCVDHCKTAELCAMICTSEEEYYPCMRPSHGLSLPVNPFIKVKHYDRSNGSLTNYNQYSQSLTEVNKMDLKKESYKLLYLLTKAYEVPDILTASLYKAYEVLKSGKILNLFSHYMTMGEESTPYDYHCKIAELYVSFCTSMKKYFPFMHTSDGVVTTSLTSSFAIMSSLIIVFVVVLVTLYYLSKRRYCCSRQHEQFNDFNKFKSA